MKPKLKVISDVMRRRCYRVRAYVNPKTGNVLRIVAGCRTWKSFTEAVAHYAGGGGYARYIKKWRDVEYHTQDFIPDVWRRNEALLTIARVAAKVYRYQSLCKKRHARS